MKVFLVRSMWFDGTAYRSSSEVIVGYVYDENATAAASSLGLRRKRITSRGGKVGYELILPASEDALPANGYTVYFVSVMRRLISEKDLLLV